MHVEVYVGWAIADTKKVATVLNSIRDTVPQAEEYCADTQPIVDFALRSLEELKILLNDNPFIAEHIENAMYRYVDSVRVRINELRHELGAP